MKQFEQINASYTKIPNELLNDRRISWKAKGLFCHMASKTNNFHFTVRVLAKNYPDGKAAIFAALDELKDQGWITFTKKANGYGKYKLNTTILPESDNQIEAYPESDNRTKDTEPETDNRTKQAKPKSDFPEQGFPILRKSERINKNIVFNNKELYKGDAEKSGEKNFKHVQDASIALSTAMDIDQIILKQTGGDVNVKH